MQKKRTTIQAEIYTITSQYPIPSNELAESVIGGKAPNEWELLTVHPKYIEVMGLTDNKRLQMIEYADLQLSTLNKIHELVLDWTY